MAASDPEVATRAWQDALNRLVGTKRAGSANRARWETFAKNKALKPLLKLVVLETRADQLLSAVVRGKVSTNVYLRRLQNFCIGMNWLPWPVLPHKWWPRVTHKSRRAITRDEHLMSIARECNAERRDFYELLWHLGGAQTDIACLEAEDIDWNDCTICYNRKKLAGLDATQVKPPQIKFGKKCAELLKTLPQTGPIFPSLRTVDCKYRATEFGQRCKGLKIVGITLHSYR